MRLPALPLIALSCLLSAPSATAQSPDLYVDAAAATTFEDGTAAYPFHGIQDALDIAQPGDTVHVLPGIYYGVVELADQVRLVSEEGPWTTVIDGMGADFSAVKSPPPDGTGPRVTYAYIDGFSIRNAGSYALVIAENRTSFWTTSHFEMHNCILDGDGTSIGMQVYPRVYSWVTRTEARNVGRAFDAIWCQPSFDNVTVHDVDSVFFLYGLGCTVDNTTVTDVTSVVELWGSNGWASVTGTSNNFHAYSLLGHPNDAGGLPYLSFTASLSVDPLFNDPAAGDYTLQAASPLVDAGSDVGLPYLGVAPDIGAYEREASLTSSAEGLVESYSKVLPSAFKNPAEQRRNAIQNKLLALVRALGAGSGDPASDRVPALQGARQRLVNDIWAKSDGHFGGNPANDWILTLDEQTRLKEKVDGLLAEIDAELVILGGQ